MDSSSLKFDCEKLAQEKLEVHRAICDGKTFSMLIVFSLIKT